MLTDEELELGGFRFEDLQEKRIVKNRTDLLASRPSWSFRCRSRPAHRRRCFLKSEVYAWLRERAALRDAKIPPDAEITSHCLSAEDRAGAAARGRRAAGPAPLYLLHSRDRARRGTPPHPRPRPSSSARSTPCR